MHAVIRQVLAIWIKNFRNNLSNKKKLFCEFFFPCMISLIYYFYKKQDSPIDPITIVLNFLLTIYIGLINSSSLREAITLFITEREENFRQYQNIFGLKLRTHTLANLFYMMMYTSVFIFPFYVVVNLYGFHFMYIFNFAAFVISSNTLTLMLTSFFTEHKMANEVIGILFSLTAFLPLVYSPEQYNFKHYLAIIFPNSSFTIAILSSNPTESWKISIASLLPTKFYLLIYYSVEFRQDFIYNITGCCRKIKSTLFSENVRNEILMEQIELESYSVLSQYTQNEDMNSSHIPALEINDVVKDYGDVVAVNKVSLKIYKSQIFGLLGRNGAGKTTLVDMITKVTKPSSGKIILHKMGANSTKMGICYQQQILYEELTVKAHLQFYADIKGVQHAKEEIDDIVQKVGIEGELAKKVKELSGGNKRKLSVSIALLGKPDLLIFDEPTSGLDPLSRRNIWKILQNLKELKSTIILTTHHLDEADHLSDRICVIEKGMKIAEGKPDDIKQKYGRGYYLNIHHNEDDEGFPFVAKVYKKIVTDEVPSVELLEQESDSLKYFISQQTPFQKLTETIQRLEIIDGIRISLQANSLEQSFIAIISQKQSMENVNINPQHDHIHESQSTNWSQIKGTMLKNLYCFLRKYHYIYLMNLILLAIISVIDIFLIRKIAKQSQESGEMPPPNEQYTMSTMYIIQGYIIMSSAFIMIPVQEKQDKIIRLLRTRGLTTFNYWLGHYLFDISYFLINYGILRIWFPKTFQGFPMAIVFLTGSSMIFYSYCVSLIFEKKKTANSWFTIINSIFWFIYMPLMLPGNLMKQTTYSKILINFKYFYPYYDIGVNLLKKERSLAPLEQLGEKTQQNYVVFYSLIFYIAILVIFEGQVFKRLFKKVERMHVNEILKLENVSHKYQEVEALKNVSYSVNNERLALLGHNGAGKSTTFALLSSQLHPTEGQVYLENERNFPYNNTMKSAGICYQDDTLWPFMRTYEIFNVFSLIVGLKDRESERKWLFNSIEFTYAKKKFENLSGGNKRKLCMAVCLMGGPQIRLLDECSTGLDPVSRLSMVKTIKIQPEGATVFTTHSIPEAEDLCSRAVIMKKGEVCENLKIYKLKQKYYHCYWVKMALRKQTDIFQKVAIQIFNELKETHVDQKLNKVEIPKQAIELSKLMRLMKSAVENKKIQSFSIDEPKLEDVYLRVTGPQNQDQRVEAE